MVAASSIYPRAELLVEPDWLAAHLSDPDVRVIDCDQAELGAARPHIRGAVALPIHPYFRDWETGVGVATAQQTEQIMRGLGVSNSTHVVCYDSQGGLMATRVWWVLWHYGHEHAAVLNGGWQAWDAAGLPTAAVGEWPAPAPGDFSADQHDDRIASCDVMLPQLGGGDLLPLDVRNDLEWSGDKPAPNATNMHEGRIPGAIHLEWREFVDWDNDTRFKTADELEQLLQAAGVDRDKRVVPY
jgi:thiosulfate/3-mercaptopyruvate sulfurtransferase